MANDKFQEIAEYFGMGAGGVLFLRMVYPLLLKIAPSCSCKNDYDEIKRVQNARIKEYQEDKEEFIKFLEEYSEVVVRLDALESTTNDYREEIKQALMVGDVNIKELASSQSKHDSRLDSLESEDKELNKLISELSTSNAVLIATIKPMQKSIEKLEQNQGKMSEILSQLNSNVSILVGKISGI